jgi:hypothetical protein
MKTKFKLLVASCMLAFLTLFYSTQGFAQNKNNDTPVMLVNKDAFITKYHTIDELNAMSKGDLILLYKERIKVINSLLPYSALSTKPGTTLKDLGIPENSTNASLVEKEDKTGGEFNQAINNNLDNLIAYADKSEIIWSVLFFEEIIRKLSLGKDY